MLVNPGKPGQLVAAVMYSGGIDSTVVMAELISQGIAVVPMVFDDGTYNFAHRRMIAIERLTQHFGVHQNLVVIRHFNLEDLRYNDGTFGFVPGWKMSVQLAGMAYCQKLGITEFYTGYNIGNLEGAYGDELPENIIAMQDLYNKIYGTDIKIHSPYYGNTKAQVVALGAQLGVPFEWTNGCRQIEHGGLIHCGACEVDRRRREAFIEAGVPDPTMYANDIQASTKFWTKIMDKAGDEINTELGLTTREQIFEPLPPVVEGDNAEKVSEPIAAEDGPRVPTQEEIDDLKQRILEQGGIPGTEVLFDSDAPAASDVIVENDATVFDDGGPYNGMAGEPEPEPERIAGDGVEVKPGSDEAKMEKPTFRLNPEPKPEAE